MHTLGTAGHIDHGKTTLCKLLTGVDTDRLAEEKARGISIDLGFAHMALPSGRRIGIVDVPGHERFIRNMVAGVYGIDAVLLTIAADEGIMPQTREHLDILRLLGVTRGIIVLTKCDMVDPDWVEMMSQDVGKGLAHTPLASAPIVKTTRADPASIRQLVEAIDALTATLPARDTTGLFRMPIDRVFSLKGHGTVVTGTVISGRLAAGEAVEVLPQGLASRVRGIQSFFRAESEAHAGERAALNVPEIDTGAIARGAVACAPGVFKASALIDGKLTLLAGLPPPWNRLKSLSRVRLHVGTAEAIARVFLLESPQMEAGEERLAQFRLESPISCARDDRFLVRTFSPLVTIGGGVVVDPAPVKHRRDAAVVERLKGLTGADAAQVIADTLATGAAVLVPAADLAQAAALPGEVAEAGLAALGDKVGTLSRKGRVYRYWKERAAREGQVVAGLVARYHDAHPMEPGIDRAHLRSSYAAGMSDEAFGDLLELVLEPTGLVAEGPVVRRRAFARALDEATARLVAALEQVLLEERFVTMGALARAGGAPQPVFDKAVRYMRSRDVLVLLPGGMAAHRSTVDGYERQVVELLRGRPAVSVLEIKDRLALTRKGLIPLLEHFDEKGLTLRVGSSERKLRQGGA